MQFKFKKEYAKKYEINAENDFELLKNIYNQKLEKLPLFKENFKTYKNRLEKELEYFKNTDMPSYILTWLDILNHTDGFFFLRVPISSSILFLLGFSKIDPIKWDLIFELDFYKKNTSIIIDFSEKAKESAFNYLNNIYEKIISIEALSGDKYAVIDNKSEELFFIPYKDLRALNLIELTLKKANTNLDIFNIDLEDKKVYEFISAGFLGGVFLLDKGIFEFYNEMPYYEKKQEILNSLNYIKKLKPSSFEDLMAFHALNRPSIIERGIFDKYIENKNSSEILIYKEQIIKILKDLADFSIGEAISIYKAIAKRKINLIEKYEKEFINRAVKKGLKHTKAQEIYNSLLKNASITFSKSAALSFAYLTYLTAYVKYYYKKEFFKVLIEIEKDEFDKKRYLDEVKKLGIK